MDDFLSQWLCHLLLIGGLCIARYVFKVEGLFEWYVPAWLTRWLEASVKDLTDDVQFYSEAK